MAEIVLKFYANIQMIVGDRAVITEKYLIQQEMSPGVLGPTMLVRSQDSDALLVCKTCHKSLIGTPDRQQSFRDRLKKLSELKLPFVVPYIDVMETSEDFFLVREFVDTGSLVDFVSQTERIYDKLILTIWHMLVDAFRMLHASGVFPSPVSPQNVFIQSESSLLITDLYELGNDATSTLRTPDLMQWGFFAPEYFDGSALPGAHSDVWSLGVMLLYMKRRALPWPTKNLILMLKVLTERKGYFPQDGDDPIEAMAAAILVKDVKARPSIIVCDDTERLKALGRRKKESVLKSSGQRLAGYNPVQSARPCPWKMTPGIGSMDDRLSNMGMSYKVRQRMASGARENGSLP